MKPPEAKFRQIKGLYNENNLLKKEVSELNAVLKNLKNENADLRKRVNKRQKETLADSEIHFRSLVTASSEVLYRMSPDWSEMLQLNSHGFLANTDHANPDWLHEYIHPEDQSLITAACSKAIENKSIFELEHRVRRADGTWGWAFSRAVPILDNDGEIIEWLGAANDITRRKQAEDALNESEEKFSAAFRSNPNALVLSHRRDGTIIDVNDTFLTLFERTREEVIGKSSLSLNMFANPEDREKALSILRERGRVFNHEIKIKRRSGEERISLLSVELLLINHNEALLTTIQDITDSKRVEEELRAKATEIEAILSCIADGVVVYDRDGRIVLSNSTAVEILKYSEKEAGLKLLERVKGGYEVYTEDGRRLNPEEMPAFRAAVHSETIRNEVLWIKRNEEPQWINVSAAPLYISGKHVGGVISMSDLTHRKLVEQKLRDNEQRLKGVFNNAGIGIAETDSEDRFIAVNDRICQILEYSHDELIGKNISDITFPDDRALSKEVNTRLQVGEFDSFNYEKRYLKSTGNPIWVHLTVSATRDLQGNYLRSVITVEDITERKKTEEVIQRSEAILKQAGIMTNIGAWEVEFLHADEAKNPLHWSDQVYRIFGYTPGSVPVNRELFYKHVHPDDRKKVLETVTKAIKEKKAYSVEHRIIRADGAGRTVIEHAELSFDKSGKAVRIIGAIQDITERKLAEEKLIQALSQAEEGKNTLTALMESIPIGITIADGHDVTIRMVSRYGQEILEKTNDEITGIPAPEHPSKMGVYRADGVTPGSPEELPLSRATLKGEIVKNELWFVTRKDGLLLPILCNAAPILDRDKKVVGGIMGWQDIAELKRIEGELQQRNEELTRFIYTVSHDLKSPLVTIKMFTLYLKDDIKKQDKESLEKDLGYIENAADKMAKLLDELLELSRIGRKEEPKSEVLLETLAQTVIELLAGRIRERNVKVKITAPPVLLYGYKQRLTQLYQNLLDNALKFMGNQPEPVVEIGAFIDKERNNELVLFVRDNGSGIDPRYQDKLFGLFEKLNPDSEGTGIGLALVKRIIEVHEGQIWLTSEGKNKGTTFYFTLARTRLLT